MNIKDLWNSQADHQNQWDSLGEDEKLEFAMAHEREECAKFCETNQVWVGQGKRGFSKWGEEDFVAGGRHQGMDYADAIRARSEA